MTQIDSEHVIKLMLQYLRENNLHSVADDLTDKTGVVFYPAESITQLCTHIKAGKWDAVLLQLHGYRFALPLLMDLYEHILLELVEMGEFVAARSILRQTRVCHVLRESDEARYTRLDRLVGRIQPIENTRELYADRDAQRQHLIQRIQDEISVVPSARLLALLGQAIQWQKEHGYLEVDADHVDIFTSQVKRIVQKDASVLFHSVDISFSDGQYAETLLFLPSGDGLITATSDGLIEVWTLAGKHATDLAYQSTGNFMVMNDAVLCLAFSDKGDLLASGSTSGMVKVWNIQTGQCMRMFQASSQGILALAFTSDNAVVSASFDNALRIHGLRTGKQIKHLVGHTGAPNGLVVVGGLLVSGGSDGKVILWDMASSSIHATIDVSELEPDQMDKVSVLALYRVGGRFCACTSTHVHLFSMDGVKVRSIPLTKPGQEVVATALSQQGVLLHAIVDGSTLVSVSLTDGKVVNQLTVTSHFITNRDRHSKQGSSPWPNTHNPTCSPSPPPTRLCPFTKTD
jgi:WD40 repeat-containing protein SMU1